MASTRSSVPISAWLLALGMALACAAAASGSQPVLKPERPIDEAKRSPSDQKPAKRQAAKPGKKRTASKPRGKAERPARSPIAPAGVEETLVMVLRHAAADRAAHHVERLFRGSAPVWVSADGPANILMVRADAETLAQVRQMVKRYEDAAAKSVRHVERNVRVFRIQHADAQRVATMIQELAPFSEQVKPPTIEWDVRTNAVLINAADTDWEAIETIIRAVDVQD
jgi:type II secretory pathway component GspD/PulD (secretin)